MLPVVGEAKIGGGSGYSVLTALTATPIASTANFNALIMSLEQIRGRSQCSWCELSTPTIICVYRIRRCVSNRSIQLLSRIDVWKIAVRVLKCYMAVDISKSLLHYLLTEIITESASILLTGPSNFTTEFLLDIILHVKHADSGDVRCGIVSESAGYAMGYPSTPYRARIAEAFVSCYTSGEILRVMTLDMYGVTDLSYYDNTAAEWIRKICQSVVDAVHAYNKVSTLMPLQNLYQSSSVFHILQGMNTGLRGIIQNLFTWGFGAMNSNPSPLINGYNISISSWQRHRRSWRDMYLGPRIFIPYEIISDTVEVLDAMGPRGLLLLLGIRTTVGSVDMAPPCR